jgi:hypothetical protein
MPPFEGDLALGGGFVNDHGLSTSTPRQMGAHWRSPGSVLWFAREIVTLDRSNTVPTDGSARYRT